MGKKGGVKAKTRVTKKKARGKQLLGKVPRKLVKEFVEENFIGLFGKKRRIMKKLEDEEFFSAVKQMVADYPVPEDPDEPFPLAVFRDIIINAKDAAAIRAANQVIKEYAKHAKIVSTAAQDEGDFLVSTGSFFADTALPEILEKSGNAKEVLDFGKAVDQLVLDHPPEAFYYRRENILPKIIDAARTPEELHAINQAIQTYRKKLTQAAPEFKRDAEGIIDSVDHFMRLTPTEILNKPKTVEELRAMSDAIRDYPREWDIGGFVEGILPDMLEAANGTERIRAASQIIQTYTKTRLVTTGDFNDILLDVMKNTTTPEELMEVDKLIRTHPKEGYMEEFVAACLKDIAKTAKNAEEIRELGKTAYQLIRKYQDPNTQEHFIGYTLSAMLGKANNAEELRAMGEAVNKTVSSYPKNAKNADLDRLVWAGMPKLIDKARSVEEVVALNKLIQDHPKGGDINAFCRKFLPIVMEDKLKGVKDAKKRLAQMAEWGEAAHRLTREMPETLGTEGFGEYILRPAAYESKTPEDMERMVRAAHKIMEVYPGKKIEKFIEDSLPALLEWSVDPDFAGQVLKSEKEIHFIDNMYDVLEHSEDFIPETAATDANNKTDRELFRSVLWEEFKERYKLAQMDMKMPKAKEFDLHTKLKEKDKPLLAFCIANNVIPKKKSDVKRMAEELKKKLVEKAREEHGVETDEEALRAELTKRFKQKDVEGKSAEEMLDTIVGFRSKNVLRRFEQAKEHEGKEGVGDMVAFHRLPKDEKDYAVFHKIAKSKKAAWLAKEKQKAEFRKEFGVDTEDIDTHLMLTYAYHREEGDDVTKGLVSAHLKGGEDAAEEFINNLGHNKGKGTEIEVPDFEETLSGGGFNKEAFDSQAKALQGHIDFVLTGCDESKLKKIGKESVRTVLRGHVNGLKEAVKGGIKTGTDLESIRDHLKGIKRRSGSLRSEGIERSLGEAVDTTKMLSDLKTNVGKGDVGVTLHKLRGLDRLFLGLDRNHASLGSCLRITEGEYKENAKVNATENAMPILTLESNEGQRTRVQMTQLRGRGTLSHINELGVYTSLAHPTGETWIRALIATAVHNNKNLFLHSLSNDQIKYIKDLNKSIKKQGFAKMQKTVPKKGSKEPDEDECYQDLGGRRQGWFAKLNDLKEMHKRLREKRI
ncbi:MAG: hypothetical protein KAW41_06940 [Candidatus Diapherotrites archaeon]|nr:hypothetical protein [Candidatus Diapherotrites archaeon]